MDIYYTFKFSVIFEDGTYKEFEIVASSFDSAKADIVEAYKMNFEIAGFFQGAEYV